MRIVYIADSNIPSKQANTVHVMKMCEAMTQNGHEVTLIAQRSSLVNSMTTDELFEYYGISDRFAVRLLSTPKLFGRLFVFGWRAARFSKKLNSDIIYGRSLVGLSFAKYIGIPVVYEIHGTVWESGWRFLKLFQSLLKHSQIIRLVAISNALKLRVLQEVPQIQDKVIVCHDAANPPISLEGSKDLLRKSDRFRVGYVGNVYPGRGIELIIQCALLCEDVEFHIIGAAKEDLKRVGISDHPGNVILHGFVPPNRVDGYRSQMDALLAPYQRKLEVAGGRDTSSYMSPLKLFEYMASSKPIICSDLPVLREVLCEKSALLVEPDCVNEWVNGIRQLQKDGQLRSSLSAFAYDEFQRNYTWFNRARLVLDGLGT